MNLDRVTITGADDSISPDAIVELSQEFPYAEWGILVSSSSIGKPRFPSFEWLRSLWHRLNVKVDSAPAISIHVCGKWVRDICQANWTPIFTNLGPILDHAERVQLNFHACTHLIVPQFVEAAKFRAGNMGWQIIFQCDGVNDHLVSNAYDDGLDAVPLYDRSGGAGIVPDSWPRALKGIYSGYAGGLGPDNLLDELPKIAEAAAGERFWIDCESRVRSDDDRQFDLAKVRRFLEISSEFVTQKV